MDELGCNRQHGKHLAQAGPHAPPQQDRLAERDTEAEAADRAAADRDRDAAVDDARAACRDRAAEARDAEAAGRERQMLTDPVPPLFADRRKARADREDAAADRAAAAGDRVRASSDRQTAAQHRKRAGQDRSAAHRALGELRDLLNRAEHDAEAMVVIGQAQGMIMSAHEATPLEAILELGVRAAEDRNELAVAARAIAAERSDNGTWQRG